MHLNFDFNFNFNFNLPLFQLVRALLPRHFLCYCLAALIQLQQWICFENILDNDNFKSAQTLVLHCCSITVRFFGICKKADLAFGFSGCPGRSLPLVSEHFEFQKTEQRLSTTDPKTDHMTDPMNDTMADPMTIPMTVPLTYTKSDTMIDPRTDTTINPITNPRTDIMTVSITDQNCDVRTVLHSYDVFPFV